MLSKRRAVDVMTSRTCTHTCLFVLMDFDMVKGLSGAVLPAATSPIPIDYVELEAPTSRQVVR